ncbi:MAG: VOC family protein [Verrucomicrobiaceae bacterium]|nr:MAG: VOC family protein [Verrucomicrobiaceae bacterium]
MQTVSYPPLIPSIAVRDAAAALSFYQAAFGAVERFRLTDPESGKIGHAEFTINGQVMMIAEEYPAFNKAPETLGGVTAKFALMVPNADAAYEQAIAAGATPIRPPSDQFYGHRSACLKDPFGHEWMLQHVIEEVSPEEMQRRWNEMTQPCTEK